MLIQRRIELSVIGSDDAVMRCTLRQIAASILHLGIQEAARKRRIGGMRPGPGMVG